MIVYSFNSSEKRNAGPKAPADIDAILKKQYKAKIKKINKTFISKIFIVFSFIFNRVINQEVVIQHPFIYKPWTLKLLNKNKTIILIHDISGLRNQNNSMLEKEIKIFKKFKYIIAHNEKMAEFLEEKGINKSNIYNLQIFDYLVDKNNDFDEINLKENYRNIVYAGNLSKNKCPFLYQLEDLKMEFTLNAYGINAEECNNEKIEFKGSFDPEDLTTICGNAGLIWDGNFDESDIEKAFKNYTKYNNPHKLSCYLAAGLPVIVWNKAAIANFVEENNIGYLIENIYEINDLDFSNIDIKKKNANEIGKMLKRGHYTIKVFEKIRKEINND